MTEEQPGDALPRMRKETTLLRHMGASPLMKQSELYRGLVSMPPPISLTAGSERQTVKKLSKPVAKKKSMAAPGLHLPEQIFFLWESVSSCQPMEVQSHLCMLLEMKILV